MIMTCGCIMSISYSIWSSRSSTFGISTFRDHPFWYHYSWLVLASQDCNHVVGNILCRQCIPTRRFSRARLIKGVATAQAVFVNAHNVLYFDRHSPNLSVWLVHASTARSSRIRQYRMPDNKISIHLSGFPINRCLSCPVSSILRVLWIEPAHPSAASLLCATGGFSCSFLRTFYARLVWAEQFERCLRETYLQNG